MSTSSTFSILFLVNPKKVIDDHVIIYVRITVNQKRSIISLKRKIPLRLWDSVKKRARGNSAEARQLNQYLDQVQSKLFQCYQDLLFKGKLITAKLIKATYLGEDDNSKSLQNLIDYHSKKIASTHAVGSIRNYGIT